MIVSVCSDKGSPGATTLAVALGLVWPGDRLVVEADPSGGVLTFRMHPAGGALLDLLAPDPTVASLGAAARLGLPPDAVTRYGHPTSLGVTVIPGPLTPERFGPLRTLWPRIADTLAAWPGTVIADLGRMQPGNPALPIAQASTAVLLLGRSDVEGLFGLRERATDLAHVLGRPDLDRPALSVVVKGPPNGRKEAMRSAELMLTAAGSPVRVAGFLADDPTGATALWAGQVTRKLAGGDLVRSTQTIAETLISWWPTLTEQPAAEQEPAGAPADTVATTDTTHVDSEAAVPQRFRPAAVSGRGVG